MEALDEVAQFLDPDVRLDVKSVALEYVLSITADHDGQKMLPNFPNILRKLIILMQSTSTRLSKDSASCLINISSGESGSNSLVALSESDKSTPDEMSSENLIQVCIRHILNKQSQLADQSCIIISNITRLSHLVDRILAIIDKSGFKWSIIAEAFTTKQYNQTGANLHYLGHIFHNISQSSKGRRYLMDENYCILPYLLPFTEFSESTIRRRGIVGTLKNCCFDIDKHGWLLSSKIDILTYILLPLAGPEEFDEEDNNKLPINLQYLPETKAREPEPGIRILLLEALLQLCVTKTGREILRENNTYIILRELHKWEKDKNVSLACENVVDILIRTEEEIGIDNYKEINVPEEYKDNFQQMDKDYIANF